MRRILLLRAAGSVRAAEAERFDGVDVLVTHEVTPIPAAIAGAASYDAPGATLVVSSATAVRVLHDGGAGALLTAPFAQRIAAGEGTAAALREIGARELLVPPVPGAAGILAVLPVELAGRRILWPRGSDADRAPLQVLAARGAEVAAPAVYEKRALRPLDEARMEAFCRGDYGAVAAASLAALDVFLSALGERAATLPPWLSWGALGPETAAGFARRGLPPPRVPPRARLSDLVTILQES